MNTPQTYAVVIMDDTCRDLMTEVIKSHGYVNFRQQMTMMITALKEHDTVYIRKIETEEKMLWNRNRQRKLHHYPGKRWIDTRTTNK